MSVRINTNVQSLKAQHGLSKSTDKLSKSLERLSSGLKINSGRDDAVGLMKSESLRSNIRGMAAAESSISIGQSVLGVAEGALAQLTEIAQQMREKVTGAVSDTLSASDRTNVGTAVTDLLAEFDRIVGATEFDGVKLLDGSFSSKNIQVGAKAGDKIAISISDASSATIGAVTIGGTGYNLNDVSVATAADAENALQILDKSISDIQTSRANIGSKAVRLDAAKAELQTRSENYTQAESEIRDADVAQETAAMTSNQILQQAGATVLSKANSLPQVAMSLLQG